jgi:RHS repeat-associated protein
LLFGRHVAELNASDNALVRTYVWGLDLSGTEQGAGGVGGLLMFTHHGSPVATHFSAYDGNGNVVVLVSASDGSPTAHYEYGPFGEPIRVSGPAAALNPFRFSTKRVDPTTDLLLYEYRAYGPSLGRWLSRDLVAEVAGPSPYAWIQNDPVNTADFLGLLKVCCRGVESGRPHEQVWRHCEIKDRCLAEEQSYPIWTDNSCKRTMDDGKPCCCATKDDIQRCLERHPYSAAPRGPQDGPSDYVGNNCQTSVILTLGHCCLKSSWTPNWYAGPRRGKCLIYEVIVVGESAFVVCTKWEVPDWWDNSPPAEPDPRLPNLPPGYGRPKPRAP